MAFKFLSTNWPSGKLDACTSSSFTDATDRDRSFPVKLATVLGLVQILLAVLITAFGVLALREEASMSAIGSGMWCGIAVLICGLLGIASGQRVSRCIVVSFLLASILSMAVSCLLIIFTASGLARDLKQLNHDELDNQEVFVHQRPMIVNVLLVALGITEALISVASVFICARDICMCYSPRWNKVSSLPNWNLLTADTSPEGQARAYRLLRWLGQPYHHSPPPPPVNTPMISIISPVATPLPYPTYMIPSMIPTMIPTMSHSGAFAGYTPFYPLNVPSLYTSSESQDDEKKRKEKKRRRRGKTKTAAQEERLETCSLPEEGADRDVGEEFIFHSLEPCLKAA